MHAPVLDAPLVMALEARQLSCRRGGRRLFAKLDLTLRCGQVLWLRGDNGRGKTSLLRLLAGLVEPEHGDVLWFGQPARKAAAAAVQPLYVAHANALKDDLTVREVLTFLAELSAHAPAPDEATVTRALARVGMERVHDRLVRTLSQGQRRRVALARLAMPTRARIWLLDEPYDALDQGSIAALNGILREHVQRGGAIVLTSHQMLGEQAPDVDEFWLHDRPRSAAAGGAAEAVLHARL